VTAGLPAPGPLADDAGVVELVLDAVLLDFELLPHAASNTPAAASAANAATARPRATWNMIESLSPIRCLLVVTFVMCLLSSLRGRGRAELPHRGPRRLTGAGAYSAGCEDVLKKRERALDGEREQRYADRGPEHA
jgi:hypothetical protein